MPAPAARALLGGKVAGLSEVEEEPMTKLPKLNEKQIDALMSLFKVIEQHEGGLRGVLPGNPGMMPKLNPPTAGHIQSIMAAYDRCKDQGLDEI
jgi:hypothetical protein